MTIDEAIKKQKNEAKQCREEIIQAEYLEPQEKYYNSQCVRLAEEHEQLAEWLLELKAYKDSERLHKRGFEGGYTKAIQDFTEALIPRLTDAIYQKDVEGMRNLINDVAEQLKEGSADNEL